MLRKRLEVLVAAAMKVFLLGVAAAVMVIVVLVDKQPAEDQPAEAQTGERPNIVFVMADDLDEGSMAQLGGIQSIMGSNGATFDNAYVTYSLCCPSRASFLRGQYPHNHQILHTNPPLGGHKKFRDLGRDQSTIATWLNDLNDAGYETKYIGKYMNGYDSLYVPPSWDEWFVFQGEPTNNKINDDGTSITVSGNSTDAFAAQATDFIERSSRQAAPFFAVVGTRAPHTPPEVASRHQGTFADAPLPHPPNFDEADLSDKPQWISGKMALTQDEINSMQDLYRDRLRSMLAVEDLLERIVATLQKTGELPNTYIFFTSDNGFHMGNHRLRPAKSTLYEEDIGVPLMVRGPGVPAGAVRNQLVINNDLAPTIADLAGAPTPAFVDGTSFAPLLTASPPSSWRRAFLEEGWMPEIGLQIPTHKGVHTNGYAFTNYETGERELYDLARDPDQLQSKPRAGNEQLYSALETRRYNLGDCSASACHTAEWTTDTTSPRVIKAIPGANATGVDPATNITATFSEDMMASSINGSTFRLRQRGSTTNLAASVSYDAATDKATLDPTNPLRAGVTYQAVVTPEASDLAGNPLDQDSTLDGLQQKQWAFTVSTS